MIEKRKKVLKIDKNNYVIYQFPLEQSLEGFEKLTKTVGGPFIDLFSGVILNLKQEHWTEKPFEVLQKCLKPEHFIAFKGLFKSLNKGDMYDFMTFFIDRPDYIKCNGKSINIKEVHETYGLKHLWELTFKVIHFNYFDFLSQGGEMPQS